MFNDNIPILTMVMSACIAISPERIYISSVWTDIAFSKYRHEEFCELSKEFVGELCTICTLQPDA